MITKDEYVVFCVCVLTAFAAIILLLLCVRRSRFASHTSDSAELDTLLDTLHRIERESNKPGADDSKKQR